MIDEQEIRSLSERIVEEFQPQRIILFGSYAAGRPTPNSDVAAGDSPLLRQEFHQVPGDLELH